ncbi:MAG: sucrase/ferredoxin-like domain-containing protein [Gemmatimonadota bacterium]
MSRMGATVFSSRGEWPLGDTVKPYHRHFLACTGGRDWPARIEEAEGLLGRMARDVREASDAERSGTKLTATDETSEGGGLDLLVFPDALRYRGVDGAAWAMILETHVKDGRVAGAVRSVPLDGHHVFVCVHGNRDERCGCWGPPVVEALRTACAEEGVDVKVRATSHVGGHKYAGNVIVYPEGVWYGYVRPEDAGRLVREHLADGRVVVDLLRGRMEAPPLGSSAP